MPPARRARVSRRRRPRGEYLRVYLRNGRRVEGWNAGDLSAPDLEAINLEVQRVLDQKGQETPRTPLDSFILASQIIAVERIGRSAGPARVNGKRTSQALDRDAAPSDSILTLERPITPPPDSDFDSGPIVLDRVIRLDEPRKGMVEPRSHRRSPLRYYLLAVLVASVVALAADAIFATMALRDHLTRARSSLQEGGEALLQGDYRLAEKNFRAADEASLAAGNLLGHPSLRILSHVPWLGNNVQALEALERASHLSSEGGYVALRGVDAMGHPSGGIVAAVYSGGKVHIRSVGKAEPYLRDLANILGSASSVLEATPEPSLGSIRTSLSIADVKLRSAQTFAYNMSQLADALPSLFGRDQQRRYLLLFQATSEARATGGALEYYGILKAEDGRLDLSKVRAIRSLRDVSVPVSAPRWFTSAYTQQGRLISFADVNRSPDFPVVSQAVLQLFQSSTGRNTDGIILMDPASLGELTRATGPVREAGLNVSIGPANAQQILGRKIYERFAGSTSQRDRYVSGVIEKVWKPITDGDVSTPKLVDSLVISIKSSHFKVYSRVSSDRGTLERIGAGGDLDYTGNNVVMAFNDNISGNKVDYFMGRSANAHVVLTRTGEAFVDTTVRFTNDAPSGPPSLLLGGRSGALEAGTNRSKIGILIPASSQVSSVTVDGSPATYATSLEGDFKVLKLDVELAPGESAEMVAKYIVPQSYLPKDETTFEFAMLPQPGVEPTKVSVTVEPPADYAFRSPYPAGVDVDGDGVARLRADGTTAHVPLRLGQD
jgi:Protein of unknown function (DUF4012)